MFLSALILLLLCYTLICVYFYVQQRSLLYFPVPARGSLETIGVPTETEGIRASVANQDSQNALVYFGGNAEDVSSTAEELSDRFPDTAVYALHYRGYGDSSGSPSEPALVADASALLDLVLEKHGRVRVVGRSLGSGIAIQAVAGRSIDGLSLVTPYGSIREIARRAFPYFPVSLLIKDAYDSTKHAPGVASQVNVIVAEHDEVIPRWSTDDLIDSLGERATVTVLHGRTHNDVQLDAGYWNWIAGG